MTLGQVSFPTIITLDQKSITDINLENLQGHGNTTCFSWKKKIKQQQKSNNKPIKNENKYKHIKTKI